MSEQRPERPTAEGAVTAAQWAAFLEARIREELETVHALEAYGGWGVTEPGARRFGVQEEYGNGRVIAPVLTGSGHWRDQATALHIVRNQPLRSRDDLTAKLMLIGLLKGQTAADSPLGGALTAIVRQFAAPFIDHPDHPEYEPPEET